MDVTQLFPDAGPTSVDALVSDLQLGLSSHDGRPYVVLNMVESLDGRATVGGKVGALTGPVDQRILYRLRAQAEALLVGAGTVRNERYGSLFPDTPADQPKPLVVIVSSRLDLPPDLPLFAERDARVLIATPSDGTLAFDHAASVDYLRVPAVDGGADVASILAALRREHGVRSVVCEGGPTLNESLLGGALVDELFLSLSPLIVGGSERALADSASGNGPQVATLMSVATAENYLFLRYALL
jgi:riboflavin-specific deaminase-like protein